MTEKPTAPKLTSSYDERASVRINWNPNRVDRPADTDPQTRLSGVSVVGLDTTRPHEFRAIASGAGHVDYQVRGEAECPRCGNVRPTWCDIQHNVPVKLRRSAKCGRCAKPWWGRIADRVNDIRDARAADQFTYEDRNCCQHCEDDWLELPWWRKVLARIGGRR